MSRTHYQMYQEQTFVLAKTLIVKHEEIASSMNDELNYSGYIVDTNPYNWRYYLNLSGEYHKADKDELYHKYGTEYVMIKLPSDSGPVDVPLTKELLHGPDADRSMANEYQIGSKFYTELVSRYPDYETLIIGLLNPIDIRVAVEADNGEILHIAGRYKRIDGDRKWFYSSWYSVNEILIEPQEDNIILELQKYIDTFLRHWNNPDYAPGNDLYTVTMLGILYCNIPMCIFNARLGNCKTPRAHTFHIKQYLESHGQIGRYVDLIPVATSLWLYRNAMWLEANAGKQQTFDALLDNTLTPNTIPMSAYSVRHELSNMSDDKLLPTGMLYKEVLNFEIVGASDDDRTVRDILEDQIGLARDNDKDLDEKELKIQDAIDWGGDDRLNSKVLETEIMDLGEPYPFTLQQFLFNMWGYSSIKGYYVGSAYGTNPLTGDRLSFSSKNAYIMAAYCLNRAVAGITLERVPRVRLYQVPRTNNVHDLPSDPEYTEKPDINKIMGWCVSEKTRRLKVLEIMGSHQPDFFAQDSAEFNSNVRDIYDERVRRYNTYCDVEELEERGDLELVTKRLYWMGFEEAIVDMSYTDWFRTVGFNPDQFDNNDLLILGLELVASATGILDDPGSRRKWLQKSLIAIMKHFISYTVHIIEKFSDGVVAYLEGQTLRFSDLKWSYIGNIPVKYNIPLDYIIKTTVHHPIHIDISNVFEDTVVDVKSTMSTGYDLSNLLFGQTRHKLDVGIYALNTEIKNIYFDATQAPSFEIHVVDDVVNAFVLNPISAALRDSTYILDVSADNVTAALGMLTASSNDEDLNITGFDYDNQGTAIVNVVGNVVDDRSNVGREDGDVVKIVGIQVGMSDDPIAPISVIDSLAIDIGEITGRYNDDVLVSGYSSNHIDLGVMTGEITDSDINNTNVESNIINTDGISIRFADPQIPEVVAPSDIVAGTIVNISGRSDSTTIDSQAIDSNVLNINNIVMKINDEGLTVTMPHDTYGIAVDGITMSRRDVSINSKQMEVGQSLIIGDIGVVVKDTPYTVGIIDNHSILTSDISIRMTDGYTAEGYSVNTINITGVSLSDKYDSFNIKAPKAVDMITINDITAKQTDVAKYYPMADTDVVIVNGITINQTDYNRVINQTDDIINSIIVDGISGRATDRYDASGSDDVDNMMINLISAKVIDTDVVTRANEKITLDIDQSLISVNLNDIEVDENLADDQAIYLNQSNIKVVVRNPEIILNSNVERDTVINSSSSILITVTDETEKYNMPTEVSGVVIKADSITMSQLDTVSVTDTQSVTLDNKSINVNKTDDDTELASEDNPNAIHVNTGRIKININDESDDSNSQP